MHFPRMRSVFEEQREERVRRSECEMEQREGGNTDDCDSAAGESKAAAAVAGARAAECCQMVSCCAIADVIITAVCVGVEWNALPVARKQHGIGLGDARRFLRLKRE